MACPPDEYLQIVETAEQILGRFQPVDVPIPSLRSRFRNELQGVAKLLDCDADRVETFGIVHGAGGLDSESTDTARRVARASTAHSDPRPDRGMPPG